MKYVEQVQHIHQIKEGCILPERVKRGFLPQGEDYERYLMKSEKKAGPGDLAFCHITILFLNFMPI